MLTNEQRLAVPALVGRSRGSIFEFESRDSAAAFIVLVVGDEQISEPCGEDANKASGLVTHALSHHVQQLLLTVTYE